MVGTVGRRGGGSIAAHEGRDGAESGGGEVGQQVAEGVRVVGEAVESDGQGTVANFEVVKFDVVGLYGASVEISHGGRLAIDFG